MVLGEIQIWVIVEKMQEENNIENRRRQRVTSEGFVPPTVMVPVRYGMGT